MPRFTVTDSEIVFDDGGMNLLSSEALYELRSAVSQLRGDVVVFRSGRSHIFAAGADMAEMSRFTPWQAYEFARLGQEVFAMIENLPCITVAMIDGDCFGGALDLILSFDLRYATPRSRFSHPGAKLGIVTGFGGTSRWRKVLSRPAAHQLFLANRVLSAEEAQSFELIDGIGDPDLDRLRSLDPATTRMVKELTNRAPRLAPRDLVLLAERLAKIES
ncbi:MAG TPA: enoyl-CoA hydratase/isomerase family protein [Thermoanaerobaculia bacterium]|nr:enoyl-CoA hydratase/isomerase family protein [Thermoanaerobaculia bacterium]